MLITAMALAGCLPALAGHALTMARAAPRAAVSTYVVNSTADADVGDGVCAAASGLCTLRAAIMQANFVTGPETITLPAGVYLLTRAGGDDADVLGDLDIADDLTIQGAGSGVTIVNGNGAVTGDRVFQILSSAKETSLSGLTIGAGRKVTNTFDEGGGLYWEGGGGSLNTNSPPFSTTTMPANRPPTMIRPTLILPIAHPLKKGSCDSGCHPLHSLRHLTASNIRLRRARRVVSPVHVIVGQPTGFSQAIRP
jgi:CSLREA domain-containing protein